MIKQLILSTALLVLSHCDDPESTRPKFSLPEIDLLVSEEVYTRYFVETPDQLFTDTESFVQELFSLFSDSGISGKEISHRVVSITNDVFDSHLYEKEISFLYKATPWFRRYKEEVTTADRDMQLCIIDDVVDPTSLFRCTGKHFNDVQRAKDRFNNCLCDTYPQSGNC